MWFINVMTTFYLFESRPTSWCSNVLCLGNSWSLLHSRFSLEHFWWRNKNHGKRHKTGSAINSHRSIMLFCSSFAIEIYVYIAKLIEDYVQNVREERHQEWGKKLNILRNIKDIHSLCRNSLILFFAVILAFTT